MKFFTAFVIVTSFIVATLADHIIIQDDITQKIGPQITTLNNDLNAFPASGLAGAVGIHLDANALVATVDEATSDVESTGSFGSVDGTTILGQMQNLLFSLFVTLDFVVRKKSDFQNLPNSDSPALVLSDLRSLNTSFASFTDKLITSEPLPQKAEMLDVGTQIRKAFATAIEAYLNV